MTDKRNAARTKLHARRFLKALLEGDSDEAGTVVRELFSAGVSVGAIYVDVLGAAMAEVGQAWCKGKVNVAQEHLATQITLAQMDSLRRARRAPEPLPYRAIVGCVEREQHFLAARMTADLFEIEGWSVDFLGPDVPGDALLEMISARRPDLVALSVTLRSNLPQARRLLGKLKRLPEPPRVVIGGHAAQDEGAWKDRSPGVKVASTIIEGLSVAKQLVARQSRRITLADTLKELGRRIRGLRGNVGWTQRQLARATGLTRATVVSVEGGKQNVSMDVVVRIANALAVAPESLLAPERRSARSDGGLPGFQMEDL
ncbi:MAG TPA: cobalamin-dependent protein [Candidatus Eisenbacteria bacterium]|nr:cobalamin-dependent protein [Candidatus Eisenbacteria bacterium]